MQKLIKKLREFAKERDWDQFHSPKNLAIALTVETAELLEEFQWLTEEQSRKPDQKRLNRIKDEISDVMIYLVQLSDQLGVDPLASAFEKIEKNRAKYPVDKAKGSAKKYTDL
ncbi:MAG: nucleotide pyrophosphohydrolase [Candidatus Desulfaltia sp.]|nr:nucleotide pyrophosphohydrolase [Candidatus Desulfaltia sp.]